MTEGGENPITLLLLAVQAFLLIMIAGHLAFGVLAVEIDGRVYSVRVGSYVRMVEPYWQTVPSTIERWREELDPKRTKAPSR